MTVAFPRFFVLLVLLACTLFFPAAARADDNAVFYGQHYISLNDIAKKHNLKISKAGSSFTLSNKAGRMVFLDEKRHIFFNDNKIATSFPMYVKNSRAYISVLDANTKINVLFSPASVPKRKVGLIVLDPGHGGKDNGGDAYNLKEKNITLRLSRKVAELLRKRGYQVVMTRNYDRNLTLQDRVDIAAKSKASLFLSIHSNAAVDRTLRGIESFCLTPPGAASSNAAGSKPSFNKHPGNQFDLNNFLLNYHIQKNLVKNTGAIDRGVKQARFHVIKEIKCPAALIEVGFLTNYREALNLNSETYMNKLAEAIANGVSDYDKVMR